MFLLLSTLAHAGDLDLEVSVGGDHATLTLQDVASCALQATTFDDPGGRWEVEVLAAATPDGRVWSRVTVERVTEGGRFKVSPSFLAADGEPARFRIGRAASVELTATGMDPGSCAPAEGA